MLYAFSLRVLSLLERRIEGQHRETTARLVRIEGKVDDVHAAVVVAAEPAPLRLAPGTDPANPAPGDTAA